LHDNKPVVFELVVVAISSESLIDIEGFFVAILQSSLTLVMVDISHISLVTIFE